MMSECEEDTWEWNFRAMPEDMQLSHLVWLCENFPEEVAAAIVVAGHKIKEVK